MLKINLTLQHVLMLASVFRWEDSGTKVSFKYFEIACLHVENQSNALTRTSSVCFYHTRTKWREVSL